MVNCRFGHTATLLASGEVLLAGGAAAPMMFDTAKTGLLYNTPNSLLAMSLVPTAELFHPESQTFTATSAPGGSDMITKRMSHGEALLIDGQVLLVGGTLGLDNGGELLSSVELFDPATKRFTSTTELRGNGLFEPRASFAVTRLPNGKVLITGGVGVTGGNVWTTEVYDPQTHSFTHSTPIGGLKTRRAHHTATLLPDGKVLITGGNDDGDTFEVFASAEIYDPTSGFSTRTPGNMSSPRFHHTATLLPDGRVLITGGYDRRMPLRTAELFDPKTGTFVATANEMQAPRSGHSATLVDMR